MEGQNLHKIGNHPQQTHNVIIRPSEFESTRHIRGTREDEYDNDQQVTRRRARNTIRQLSDRPVRVLLVPVLILDALPDSTNHEGTNANIKDGNNCQHGHVEVRRCVEEATHAKTAKTKGECKRPGHDRLHD